MKTRVEEFARTLDPATTESVRSASAAKVGSRLETLPAIFTDREQARADAQAVKDYVLDNLRALLLQLEERCIANGIQVHWAKGAESANRQILEICSRRGKPGATVVKAKSMATEEIHLNKHLEEAGYDVVETDLGEFVVQIDHDTPSHIVTPIIHKSRRQVADSFEREGLGQRTESPGELAMQARKHLRDKFRHAEVGISGVNFAVASTGRLVLVENEGNSRLSTTAPKTHIALMGIEKILLGESDLAIFLPLLAASATGQKITTYVHFISGPRREDECDGPEEVHLILLDNGRSKILGGPYRDILRCIRCGACLNVCPVYRQASGHGYGHVYSGPLGAVLAPALEGVKVYGDLAKASSLCGACEEVCPVRIPIPRMLLQLRDESFRAGVGRDGIPWKMYSTGARHPSLWRAGLKLLPMAEAMPSPFKKDWLEFRDLPERQEESFRSWWRGRS
jgi:L-lactate dehydrogenase complex protein LldF